jgi:glycosyltransferase involved in cell wall biosynthesis
MENLVASQFPSQAQCNPYLYLLKSSLAECGVESHEHTLFVDGLGVPPPVLDEDWLFRHRGRVNVLHFHWLQKFYRADSIEESKQKIDKIERFFALAHKLNYRIAYTFHNIVPHEGMGKEIDFRVRRILIENADVIYCFSHRQQTRLQEIFGPIPLTVIPHSNYIGYYPDELSTEECRQRLDLPADTKVFSYIGLIRPYKELCNLLATFSALKAQDVCLLLAGASRDPASTQVIEELAKRDKRVRCHLRWIDDAEIQLFMKAADAIVLPYHRCWSSGALLLAFSFGKPVITADPMMLDHTDGLGFFYQDGGLEAALEAAVKADDLEEMGARCLEFARAHSWSEAARQLAASYRRACEIAVPAVRPVAAGVRI